MQILLRRALVLCLVVLCSLTATAQFNNQWATFVKDTNRIRNPDGSIATQVTTDVQEKDYAFGDVNRDGWTDLVVVRKAPGGDPSQKFASYLLMNEQGTLVDRTSAFATDSSTPGDFGFSTPTCTRDGQIVDLNGDQWPDVVTSAEYFTGDAKIVSHPRVYVNKGASAGIWQGFRFEEARIPQLLTIPAGIPGEPRFTTVSAGDVTGDGFPDLYFSDGRLELFLPTDCNDRLLVNDGTGHFTDSLHTRMSATMLLSGYCVGAVIVDVNGDGAMDVVKTSASQQWGTWVAYNDPANVGTFNLFGNAAGASNNNYAIDVGDLNRDGQPDLVIGDDRADHFKLHIGNQASGYTWWGVNTPYTILSGADDGFTGQIRIADLDADGWLDVMHSSMDVENPTCARRLHIYHNRGGVIGGTPVLREEAQVASATGWKGAVGLDISELSATFDVAPFDLDNDDDIDLVIGRCVGTSVWINQRIESTTVFCAGDGSGTACPCSNPSTSGHKEGCVNSLGLAGRLRLVGSASIAADTLGLLTTGTSNGPALYFQGTGNIGAGAGAVFGDGLLCVGGSLTRLGVVFASNSASLYPRPGIDPALSVQAGLAPGDSRTYQAWYRDSNLGYCTLDVFNLTNGLAITWQN